MNLQTFREASPTGKTILVVTYPLCILVHVADWQRQRKLKKLIRKWIPCALRDPAGVRAEIVHKWSVELRDVYGK